MMCECGHDLQLGDWPFCPHGRTTLAVHPDSVPGGFWAENGFAVPTRFDSHSAHRQALAERGLEIKAKYAGENDKHLTRWDTVDLEGAKRFLESQAKIRVPEPPPDRWPDATIPIAVTDGPVFKRKDLA